MFPKYLRKEQEASFRAQELLLWCCFQDLPLSEPFMVRVFKIVPFESIVHKDPFL
jgi:hypothetical protein